LEESNHAARAVGFPATNLVRSGWSSEMLPLFVLVWHLYFNYGFGLATEVGCLQIVIFKG